MQNFRLISEFQTIHRRSFEMADTDILKPVPPAPKVPLVDGEWLQLDTAYKMARGAGQAAVPSFAYFAEQGRYETQAIGKGPILYMGAYEADTLIMDPAQGTAIATVGQPLIVDEITLGGLARRGLVGVVTPGTDLVVGWVTRLPANNNGYLRFLRAQF